jgi:hypothetical protein
MPAPNSRSNGRASNAVTKLGLFVNAPPFTKLFGFMGGASQSLVKP